MLRRGLGHFMKLLGGFSSPASPMPGNWLRARDARAKVAGCLALAVTATLLPGLPALIWCIGLGVALLLSTGGSLGAYRRFAAAPLLLSAAVALPAMFNVITPGSPWLVVCRLPSGSWGPWTLPAHLALTADGVHVAARLVARVAACLTAVFLLVSTTRPDRLWRGLRGLGTPRLAVVLLSMMHRYLELLARVAAEFHLARLSRTISHIGLRVEQQWVAAGVSTLFRRTRALAGVVHLAMWSRGYTGELHAFEQARWRTADTLLLAGLLAACAVLLVLP